MGDLWECPKCGYKFITGFANEIGPFDGNRETLDYYFKRLK